MHCDFSRTNIINRLIEVETKPKMNKTNCCLQNTSNFDLISQKRSKTFQQINCYSQIYSWRLLLAACSFMALFIGKFYLN